jgi:sugar phosphate permease
MTKRWRIFSVLAFLYVLAYFYRVAMAVLAKDLSLDLVLSPAQLGTLSGAFFYAFALTQLPLGPLLDRYGGKKIVLLTGISTTCGGVVFALAHSYPQALLGRVMLGIGSASVLMGALRIFTNWFDQQEFGRISGFIIAVGNIGNLAATAPLAWAATHVGWRTTFLAIAAIQAAALLLAQHVAAESPDLQAHSREAATTSPFTGLKDVLTYPSYWLISLLAFSWYANYMAIQGLWGGPYLVEAVGISQREAGLVLLATSLGFLVGCLFIGSLTERLFRTPKRTLIVGQTLMLGCMTCFLGPAERIDRAMLYPLFFVTGIAVSSGVAIYPLIRESFSRAITGTALTAVNFFILMGAATMQQLMGRVIENSERSVTGSFPPSAYHSAFLIPICLLAAAIILFCWSRDPRSS